MGNKVMADALELSERAKALVQKLTDPHFMSAPAVSPAASVPTSGVSELFGARMPTSEFKRASGIAFTFVGKIGVGITLERGRGFMIAKIQGSNGAPTWSAPLFIDVSGMGLGASVGFSEIESAVVLTTPAAVDRMAKSSTEFGTDLGVAAGPVAGHTSAPGLTSEFGEDTFSYSASKGALIDFSMQGTKYHVSAEINKAVYGAEASPQAILSGKVQPPAAFQALNDALAAYL